MFDWQFNPKVKFLFSNIIELSVEQITFNSDENKIITINIYKLLVAGRGTAYVFISDSVNFFNQIIRYRHY